MHVEKEIKPKMATNIPKILDAMLMKIKTEMILNNNNNNADCLCVREEAPPHTVADRIVGYALKLKTE